MGLTTWMEVRKINLLYTIYHIYERDDRETWERQSRRDAKKEMSKARGREMLEASVTM